MPQRCNNGNIYLKILLSFAFGHLVNLRLTRTATQSTESFYTRAERCKVALPEPVRNQEEQG